MRTDKRPVLELPFEVISGTSEPHDGVFGIAEAVRMCLLSAGGPADAAYSSVGQARGTAAAIRIARAYVDLRASAAAS
jgi:hypothetical protein